MISIAVDKKLNLFRKSGFQTHENGIARYHHQDSQQREDRNFLKRRKNVVIKHVLIAQGEKRNGI